MSNDNFLAEIADNNFYNSGQNLLRVKIGSGSNMRCFDIQLMTSVELPNPSRHFALILGSTESLFDSIEYAILPGDKRLGIMPGYNIDGSLNNNIVNAYCWLLPKTYKHPTTNYNVSLPGNFNSDSELLSELDNIRYSMSPGLKSSYTTTGDQFKHDINNDNIGVFVTDNSVVLKSNGAIIELGPDGMALLGERYESSTVPGKGIISQNPMSSVIPHTILTFPGSFDSIPGIDMICAIGNTFMKVAAVAELMESVTTAVENYKG